MIIKMKTKLINITVSLILGLSFSVQGQINTDAKAQLNAWSVFQFGDNDQSMLGTRFIPTINFDDSIVSKYVLDAEAAFNTTGQWYYEDYAYTDNYQSFKPYRMWIRLSNERMELRAGLQKINFGSSTMLRPLMWFDQMDPRDPLQLTDGVYALLGRYYFKNNANLWLWSLWGNKNTKGLETFGTPKKSAEFGGRFQYPTAKGEVALSLHHRPMDLGISMLPDSLGLSGLYDENRIAFDGKWDLGVGLAVELAYINTPKADDHYLLNKHQLFSNIGLDYTFGIGSGLNVTLEYFSYSMLDNNNKIKQPLNFIASQWSYPIGFIDRLSAIVYYHVDEEKIYSFINFNRQYDNWTFYIMAFWNPEEYQIINYNAERNLFAGKGIQIMTVYNF